MTRTERQAHGFIFQNWVMRKFLDIAYSGEWDIPSRINPITGKSVSIKTANWKSGIGLGDIINQFNIDEDFELLVAFYEDYGKKKKVVYMQLVEIKKEKWKQMWGNAKRDDVVKFDALVKSKEGRNLANGLLDTFRDKVQKYKEEVFKDYDGEFSINPKIDSKKQRRVQCSLGFNIFFKTFDLKCEKMKTYNLWGEQIRLIDIKLE
jgi:hypothetical protein